MLKRSVPRIAKVTPKTGGATIHAIPDIAKDVRKTFVEDTHTLNNLITERMAGYAIVAWDRNGDSHAACRTHASPIPFDLTPEFVARKLRNIL